MSGPPRDEPEQRIGRDDGAPDETVYIVGWRTSGLTVYHGDSDCSKIKRPEDIRERTREEAQAQGKPPCLYCILDGHDLGGTRDVTCPYCDEDISELPSHLPCDGATKDTVEVVSDD